MIAADVSLAAGVVIHQPGFGESYGHLAMAPDRLFVEIQRGAVVGKNCKISSHTFICDGVTIEGGFLVGHGVMFTNRFVHALSMPTDLSQRKRTGP